MLLILSGYATIYLFLMLYLISVSCVTVLHGSHHGRAGENSAQAWNHLAFTKPFRAVMFPPVQSWKHWPPGYSAFLGSNCGTFTRNSLFVCLVHRVQSAWVVFARSLEPSWVAERPGEWPGLLWRRRGTAAWRIPHSNPLIYCSSPRVCSQSLSVRKILVAKGGPP